MNQKPKQIRELYFEFCSKFTTGEIAENSSLHVLLEYLSDQMKRNNGNFIHIPSEYLCDLIKKHLGHNIEDRTYTKTQEA